MVRVKNPIKYKVKGRSKNKCELGGVGGEAFNCGASSVRIRVGRGVEVGGVMGLVKC